jgi:hypothetical protein
MPILSRDKHPFGPCSARWRLALLLLAFQFVACTQNPKDEMSQKDTMARRDINAVLRDHDQELMAVPGVVGVYVGLLDDNRTSCLKVMIVKKTPELERQIPKSLEGYPVVLDETGVIHPMRKK